MALSSFLLSLDYKLLERKDRTLLFLSITQSARVNAQQITLGLISSIQPTHRDYKKAGVESEFLMQLKIEN